MLIAKLLIGGCLGTACVTPIVMATGGFFSKSRSFWDIVGTNDDYPLLTCTGGGITYRLSLAFKTEDSIDKSNKARLYLKGWNTKTKEEINWDDDGGDRQGPRWKLKVFGRSGAVQIYDTVGGLKGFGEVDPINCEEKGMFTITKGTFTDDNSTWEDHISKITFNADGCHDNLKNKGCSIKIVSTVGLDWNPELQKQLTKNW